MASLTGDEIAWITLSGVILLLLVAFSLWYFVYGRQERRITDSVTFLNSFNDLENGSKKKVLLGIISIIDKEDEDLSEMKRTLEEQQKLESEPVPPVQNMQQFRMSDMMTER